MPITAVDPVVHVAVGLLIEGANVFITRRSIERHQGGLWEFPGGKLDKDEDVRLALERELHEELGIEVQAATPFVQVRHAYPDRTVLLDVWRIERWQGAPHGREGQEARWAAIGTLTVADFPAADRPIVRRLQLPPLYLITDSRRFGGARFLSLLERALAAGARLVQLREPHLDDAAFVAQARTVAALCRRYGAKLLVNADPSLVVACGADGVHLNSRRLRALPARPLDENALVAASCHNREELEHAQNLALDFAVLGPVQPTASHPDAMALGWDKFQTLCAGLHLPVYALGGMCVDDLPQARAAGAQGLAMVRGVWSAADMETTLTPLRGANY